MFRVIVAGGRGFNNYPLMKERLNVLLANQPEVTIISGTAAGADRLGERYAEERELPVERYPAQWDLHGKAAGYKRNQQMAEVADALVAFWDGQSRGTKHMIDIATKIGLAVRVVRY